LLCLTAILSTGFVVGCPQTELTGRYRHATYEWDPEGNPSVLASVRFSSVPPSRPPDVPPILLELSEKGQMAYVRAARDVAGSATPGAPAIREFLALVRAPVEEGKPPPPGDPLVLTRRISVTVEKAKPRDADRVVLLRLTLGNLKGGTFRSVSWKNPNPLAVDLGEVRRTQSTTFGAEAGVKLPVPAAPAQGGVSYGRRTEVVETTKLRDSGIQYVAFSSDEARLGVTAPVGIDLAGMITIDVTINLDSAPSKEDVLDLGSLQKADGTLADPKDVTVRRRFARISAGIPVTLDVAGQYQIRKVRRGGGTPQEGDDRVTFYAGTFKANRKSGQADRLPTVAKVLRTERQLRCLSGIFEIRQVDDGGNHLDALKVQMGIRRVPVRFDSQAKAWEFVAWWSRTQAPELGGLPLYLGEDKLGDLKPAEVKKVQLTYRKKGASN